VALRTHTTARLIAAVSAAAALGATTAALAADDEAPAGKSRAASASAAAYAQDDGGGTPDGYVEVSGTRSASGPGTSVRSSTRGGSASASARARASGVSLFDGLVTARLVSVSASASGSGTSEQGRVERLVVNGTDHGTLGAREAFRMGRYGRVVALEDRGSGIVGLRATLTQDYNGHPAGSVVKVAFATASARDAVAEPKPEPEPEPEPEEAKPEPDREDSAEPPKPKRRKAPRTRTLATSKGFVFPVYGKHTYSDDWGAPRQHTGTHQGTDIFADPGTPVVAVCKGKLHRVGTNDVPGNRMYLTCDEGGDEFFYAHLAAFAEDARNGLEVEAGHVVGFVGSTGDAEQTPPHLHFEIHPGGGDPVNPYPFLRAWESRRDVPAAAWVKQNGPGAVEQPGTLVVVRDFLSD
jgi:murein DD-endopeptidase MepM/ murein hydrolase activator NlpD